MISLAAAMLLLTTALDSVPVGALERVQPLRLVNRAHVALSSPSLAVTSSPVGGTTHPAPKTPPSYALLSVKSSPSRRRPPWREHPRMVRGAASACMARRPPTMPGGPPPSNMAIVCFHDLNVPADISGNPVRDGSDGLAMVGGACPRSHPPHPGRLS